MPVWSYGQTNLLQRASITIPRFVLFAQSDKMMQGSMPRDFRGSTGASTFIGKICITHNFSTSSSD